MPNFKVSIIPAGDGPVTIHDIKGEDGPSFETIYPLINANMIEIVQGKWNDVKENIIVFPSDFLLFKCFLCSRDK